MNIAVIGLGYVGLTTGLGLTTLDHTIYGVEINPQRINQLLHGTLPFYEEGLEQILKRNINTKFIPSADLSTAYAKSKVILICVDTPSAKDGSINLEYVNTVVEQLAELLKNSSDFKLFVIKSTVIPGTTQLIGEHLEALSGKKLGKDFTIAMVPEFLREGSAFKDFSHPDRLVFGVYDIFAQNLLEEIYGAFSCPKLIIDLESAEFSKYASNAFLAMKISFANELANLVDVFNLTKSGRKVNIDTITKVMGYDHRINPTFLKAGVGYGGSCFPKDVKALANFARDIGSPMTLLETTDTININQPYKIIEHLQAGIGPLEGRKIGILGLAFKPNTEDIREAPARKIINELLAKKAVIHAWDPIAEPLMAKEFPTVNYHDDIADTLYDVDAAVIVTEWPQLKEFFNQSTNIKIPIIDGRGIYPQAIRSIGRSIKPS